MLQSGTDSLAGAGQYSRLSDCKWCRNAAEAGNVPVDAVDGSEASQGSYANGSGGVVATVIKIVAFVTVVVNLVVRLQGSTGSQ